MSKSKVIVIGHRGCAAEAPENTLASFSLALQQKCDAIELDVQLSADNEIVVCHDRTIDRTTDRKGAIRQLTAAELKQADAGRWFHEQYAGERIPLLEEVLDLVPPSITLNIEIKDSCGGEIEPRLVDLLKRKDRMSNIIVVSFDFKSLSLVKRIASDIPIGLTYSNNFVDHHRLTELVDIPVYSLHPNFIHINKADVEEALSRGLKVFAYTVNTEGDMKKVLDYGLTGILTDCPGKLKALLDS
ncbi:glycerophosphodiester phosphodiesterase [Paenibacillus agaridevorans]|uniref:glycerophosphodiester phosphodiesterase n=1 Tax=Paenibacillus agaridevorans TaxID=171404 RepID=UPI001BE4966A|nr:glycerophosphodiester phosphodiesterase [Paenibacillus agaridevorans]